MVTSWRRRCCAETSTPSVFHASTVVRETPSSCAPTATDTLGSSRRRCSSSSLAAPRTFCSSRSPPPSGAGGQRRQGPAQRARTRLRETRPPPRPLNRMTADFVQSGHSDRRSPQVIHVGCPTRALKAAAIVVSMSARGGARSYTSQRRLVCWPRFGSADPGRRPAATRIDWGRADHPAGGMVGGTFR